MESGPPTCIGLGSKNFLPTELKKIVIDNIFRTPVSGTSYVYHMQGSVLGPLLFLLLVIYTAALRYITTTLLTYIHAIQFN